MIVTISVVYNVCYANISYRRNSRGKAIKSQLLALLNILLVSSTIGICIAAWAERGGTIRHSSEFNSPKQNKVFVYGNDKVKSLVCKSIQSMFLLNDLKLFLFK